MAEIVRKIGKITKYETKSYVGEQKILDLDRASEERNSEPPSEHSSRPAASSEPKIAEPPGAADESEVARHEHRPGPAGVVVSDEALSSSRSVVVPDVPARGSIGSSSPRARCPCTRRRGRLPRGARGRRRERAGLLPRRPVPARGRAHGAPHRRESGRARRGRGSPLPPRSYEHVLRVPESRTRRCTWRATTRPSPTAPRPCCSSPPALRWSSARHRPGARPRRARPPRPGTRQLQAHLVQAEKLATLGQIAAGVVHELNNPLTSIVAYTDFLVKRAAMRPDPQETSSSASGASASRRIASSGSRATSCRTRAHRRRRSPSCSPP